MMSYTGPVSPEVGALSLIVNLMEDSIYMGRNVLESLGSPRQVQMILPGCITVRRHCEGNLALLSEPV